MDEMDVLSGYDHVIQQQLRRIFMRDFSSTLGAVVAGIQISKEWDRVESPWYNLFNEIKVEPFEREAALSLLQDPVKDIYAFDPAAIEYILEQSSGRPFRIQQYALESVNQMLADGRRKITLDDVEAAHARIQSHDLAQDEQNDRRTDERDGVPNGGETAPQHAADPPNGQDAPDAENEASPVSAAVPAAISASPTDKAATL